MIPINKWLRTISNQYKMKCEYYWLGDEAMASNDIRETIDEVLKSPKIRKDLKAKTIVGELVELYNYALLVRFSKKSINIYKDAIMTIRNHSKKEGFV